ncbi:hypothetical protein Vadar_014929 [Vaccinium darrowii]|uniref:Uncharacterized protein n=1 Tax=Vaccinium darrowii TaxID=229202 RepID=A0ACB7XZE6_9ERIC|nr:hypothetical protein Vadar_014929 [Vaccinium darrowii]
MSSSAIESFNNWVLEARRMPVMNLVDCLRSKIMVQMSNRREDSATWISEIGPVMDAKLKKRIEKGRAWRVQKSSTGVYEVKSMPAVLVDLEEGTCSCGSWQYNGFVCAYVATVNPWLTTLIHFTMLLLTSKLMKTKFIQFLLWIFLTSLKELLVKSNHREIRGLREDHV